MRKLTKISQEMGAYDPPGCEELRRYINRLVHVLEEVANFDGPAGEIAREALSDPYGNEGCYGTEYYHEYLTEEE